MNESRAAAAEPRSESPRGMRVGVGDRRRKHWGWGFEDEQPSVRELRTQAALIAEHLGFGSIEVEQPVPLDAVELPAPRVAAPAALAAICRTDKHARVRHAWGCSYCDVVRAFRGRFDHPPDAVVYPRDEREIEAALEWCEQVGAAAIPYGGGTSVVGGVEPRVPPTYEAVVTVDLEALSDVLDVDRTSSAALIAAGARGPRLEAQLGAQGLTLRHFPQSFEFSSLGGWIATRAAGHFATLRTHIEDLVESVRAVTPSGAWESRRLPSSGAGVSPDRMLVGSEGILGVITQAWVRVQPRPTQRARAAIRLAGFEAGAECARELSQSGLNPENCRLIDPAEALMTGVGDGRHAILLLGVESTDADGKALRARMDRALAICAEHGGSWDRVDRRSARGRHRDQAGPDATGRWREAFLRAPYLRDTFIAMGVLSETFETAITWERFGSLHGQILGAATEAANEVAEDASDRTSGQARVTCRLTHLYPDGAAPYYTVIAPARRGEEVDQWNEIKRAVSDVVLAAGATITHHHAVGRDHRDWYDRQRPEPFAAALRGAKAAIDPRGIMNPGALIDPPST